MEIVSTEEYWQLILNDLSKVGQIITEDEEFNKMATYTWSVLQNTLVLSEDENYIKSFEEMVEIDGEGLDVLQRKVNILTTLSAKKYVPRNLIKKGLERLGIDRCEIEYDRENNKMLIATDDLDEDKLTMVTSFVNNLVSENIEKEIYIGFIPAGYKRVEYLESTGTQYIDTLYNPCWDSEITCIFRAKTVDSKSVFSVAEKKGEGIGAVWEGAYFITFYTVDGGWLSFGNSILNLGTATLAQNPLTIVEYKLNKYEITANGVSCEPFAPSEPSNYRNSHSIYLYGRNYKNSPELLISGEMFKFSVSENGKPRVELIPCLDPTGAPCMFDKVRRKAFYNAGSGDFLYPTESTTYSLRRVLPDWGKLTENGLRRLYHAPVDYKGELIEYALENNYKQIIETEMPKEGYWAPRWKETEKEIVLEWIKAEEPEIIKQPTDN
jgi:hypothetical protein